MKSVWSTQSIQCVVTAKWPPLGSEEVKRYLNNGAPITESSDVSVHHFMADCGFSVLSHSKTLGGG